MEDFLRFLTADVAPSQTADLSKGDVMRRQLPFIGLLLLAFLVYPLGTPHETEPFVTGVALTVVALALSLLVPQRFMTLAMVFPPFLWFVVIALLRDGHGGAASGYAPLVLMPVIWFALYGEREHVMLSLLGVGATLVAPVILWGAPLYPDGELRRAFFMVLAGGLLALVTQNLFQRLRAQLKDQETEQRATQTERASVVHNEIVQALATAQIALELGEVERAEESIKHGLDASKKVTSQLLDDATP